MAKKKVTRKKEDETSSGNQKIIIQNNIPTGRRVVRRRKKRKSYPVFGAIFFIVGMLWFMFSLVTCFGACSLTIPIILAVIGIVLLIIGV